MNIAISGASGFVGRHLSAFLVQNGHQIFPLGRKMFGDNGKEELTRTLSQCDVVINLAGASINKRWSTAYKEELYNSRILVTRQIVNVLKTLPHKPKLMISTSAVGYYPSLGCFDENDIIKTNGFLPTLCRQWEQEAMKCPPEIRLAITRFGVVLSPDGGALQRMSLPLKMKVATVIGTGDQPFPWISITDLCRAILFIIKTPSLHGPINFVAPQVVTQRNFTQAMGKHYHAWLRTTIPSFLFRLALGEAASFLTTGQHVIPLRLLDAGFKFAHPTLKQFWKDQK